MKRIGAFLAAAIAAGAGAQTITGKVYDETGALVSGARVVLLEDFQKISETNSSEAGRFKFDGLKPGKYQVQVKQPWFGIYQQLVPLGENDKAHVYAVLGVARAGSEVTIDADRLPGVEAPAGAVRTQRAGGKVEGLKRLSGRMPSWPEAARKRGASGAVVLHGTVKADGSVGEIAVLESPDPDLEREAVEAWQTWKFSPMKLNGQPVACQHLFVFHYRYR
jgi:TonB family protein